MTFLVDISPYIVAYILCAMLWRIIANHTDPRTIDITQYMDELVKNSIPTTLLFQIVIWPISLLMFILMFLNYIIIRFFVYISK